MAHEAHFIKDPDAQLDYVIDWSNWLATGETITNSVWTVPAGLTGSSQSINGGVRTITWLSGGTVGTSYLVANIITTSQSRVDERSFVVVVEER